MVKTTSYSIEILEKMLTHSKLLGYYLSMRELSLYAENPRFFA